MLNKLLERKYKNRKYLANGLFVDDESDLILDDDFYVLFYYYDYFDLEFDEEKWIDDIEYEEY